MKRQEEIDKILITIARIWKDAPDLRLCQLIGNCFPPGDLYCEGDRSLLLRLEETYKEEE